VLETEGRRKHKGESEAHAVPVLASVLVSEENEESKQRARGFFFRARTDGAYSGRVGLL
jgi:hypothetical protein